ncbi:TIGR01777 family oxidoreductase [Anatilimnocola sp. NA78]|uniref:TIGR01777 family oxidoreductase n=1 Tax=Anatilimnocola sp. NA78 TaxID=3415683 RepID=UPI003CE5A93B
MKIVIPGGSGQVGQMLARHYLAARHEVVVLSRSRANRPDTNKLRTVLWDAEALGHWRTELDGADVVINLAGKSVNCRYHAANRRRIIESRVKSTRAIGQAIQQAQSPPRIWLQASTATIYAHHYDAANDDVTGLIGGNEPSVPDTWRFSIDVAKAWEAAATEFRLPNTRQVLIRSAMTMSPDRGGVFDVLSGLVRTGLGGTSGDGRQYVSWIHELDFVRALDWLITHDELTGPVNLASPAPLPNADFMRTLRHAWGTKIGLPASQWMLEIGALFLRTESELILKSRRVVPTRLLESGFAFRYAQWADAARELVRRWRAVRELGSAALSTEMVSC